MLNWTLQLTVDMQRYCWLRVVYKRGKIALACGIILNQKKLSSVSLRVYFIKPI